MADSPYPAKQTRIMTGAQPDPRLVNPVTGVPVISPQMVRAIKNSPKGKLPPSIARLTKKK